MKLMNLACCLAAVAGLFACTKPNDNGYSGTNYIYLDAESNMMYNKSGSTLDVSIFLTTSLKEDIELSFIVTGDDNGVVSLENNPCVIPAGQKTGKVTLKVTSLTDRMLNLSLTLDSGTTLPAKVVLKEDFDFTVNVLDAGLTQEQEAIIDAYKASTGIDLNKYLGLVEVSTVYTASNPDSEIPLPDEIIKGATIIKLSEKSTAQKPVLTMSLNPMGLQDVLYDKLRRMTVAGSSWNDEYAYESYRILMREIGWNKDSKEVFTMSLDGITLNQDRSVEFVRTVETTDSYGDPVTHTKVPFVYDFTAYEREKTAVQEGKVGTAVDEYWPGDATANPEKHLNCDDTSEDLYACGNYVESSAVLSNDKLEFIFVLYNANDYDYSKVVATYSPNK